MPTPSAAPAQSASTGTTPRAAPPQPFELALKFALWALLLFFLLTSVLRLGFMFPVGIDHSFPEGALVARAADVAAGRVPYHDWRVWPHHFAPYGPMTYYPAGWVAARFDPLVTSLDLYAVGRAQSALALVALVILAGALVRRLGGSWLAAALAAALFMVWMRLLTYALSYRPDAPQAALSLLALWIALGGRATPRRALAALACLWLSMWFKPASWGITAALAFWIARSAGWKRAAGAMAAFAGTGLAAAAALNARWDGLLFLNMIGSLDNGLRPLNVIAFHRGLSIHALAVFIGGLVAALAAARRREADASTQLFFAALMLAYGAASLQIFKSGADINYYLETWLLCAAGCAWLLVRLAAGDLTLSPRARISFLALAAAAGLYQSALIAIPLYRTELAAMKGLWYEEPAFIRSAGEIEGPILTTYPRAAIARPAPPTILDMYQYQVLERRGRLNDAELIGRIESRSFEAIILDRADWERITGEAPDEERARDEDWYLFSPRFAPALLANYRPAYRVNFMIFLEPAPR